MEIPIFLLSLLLLGFSKEIPPIANQLFPEIVISLGYPVESHYITTSDGYINTYFRIQAKNTQIKSGLPVIYLQHGLLDSSDDWVINNETLAPGLLLANMEYDIWIGNTRGNRYSLGHINWNSFHPNSEYWDFSWQEMSLYDLPAAFQYIFNRTGQMINYIGHSQGTSIMFAALARRDQTIMKYLRKFIALGPVAYVEHQTSAVLNFIAHKKIAEDIYILDGKKFMFLPKEQRKELEILCANVDKACIEAIKYTTDVHPEVDNMKRMDVFVGHMPAGTSVQNMYYWQQLVDNKEFRMYDYGTKGNLLHYNQTTPPLIELSKINVPVHMFAGTYDELADPTDGKNLTASLTGSPNVTLKHYKYGHMIFVWGLETSYLKDVIAVIQDP